MSGTTDLWTLGVIAGMAYVTVLTRCFFFILDRPWTMPAWAHRALRYAPLVCATPASTIRFWPVMPRASSDARNSAARATSSSERRNLRHCCSRKARSFSGDNQSAFCRSVTIAPGTIELTRILCGPSSRASVRVSPLIPAFDVVYAGQTCRAFAIRYQGHVHAYLNRCAHVAMEMDWQPNRFFDDTGRWLLANAWQYGFIPALAESPQGKALGYEPWDLRWVGRTMARKGYFS